MLFSFFVLRIFDKRKIVAETEALLLLLLERILGLLIQKAHVQGVKSLHVLLRPVTRLEFLALRVLAPEDGVLGQARVLRHPTRIDQPDRHEDDDLLLLLHALHRAEEARTDPGNAPQDRNAVVDLVLLRHRQTADHRGRAAREIEFADQALDLDDGIFNAIGPGDPVVGNGYMEFNYKESPNLDNDFDMWGIYLVNIFKGEEGQMQASLVSANAYNSSTLEIEECCRYPSRKLDILKNLQYIKEGEVRNANYEETTEFFKEESHKYYFTDEKLVYNFVNNFSLDTNFQDVDFNTIALEIGLAENDKDCVVCFHALGYYAVDGINYDIIIPLYGFGDAKRNALDILYEEYNNNN